MYNNNMYRNSFNYQNNRGPFIPLIVGGLIGYGLGNNNNNSNCCPIFFPQPFYYNNPWHHPFYQQNFFNQYRKR